MEDHPTNEQTEILPRPTFTTLDERSGGDPEQQRAVLGRIVGAVSSVLGGRFMIRPILRQLTAWFGSLVPWHESNSNCDYPAAADPATTFFVSLCMPAARGHSSRPREKPIMNEPLSIVGKRRHWWAWLVPCVVAFSVLMAFRVELHSIWFRALVAGVAFAFLLLAMRGFRRKH